jgi:hypothetical protein
MREHANDVCVHAEGVNTNIVRMQTFGEKVCHPERSEGSRRPANQILRFAQDDSQDMTSGCSQKGLSPNV